jgi:hypothetical protein
MALVDAVQLGVGAHLNGDRLQDLDELLAGQSSGTSSTMVRPTSAMADLNISAGDWFSVMVMLIPLVRA